MVSNATDAKTAALKVIVLDNRIRRWLAENDPQALKQAMAALGMAQAYIDAVGSETFGEVT